MFHFFLRHPIYNVLFISYTLFRMLLLFSGLFTMIFLRQYIGCIVMRQNADLWQTDRRTNRRTNRQIPRYTYSSRVKKSLKRVLLQTSTQTESAYSTQSCIKLQTWCAGSKLVLICVGTFSRLFYSIYLSKSFLPTEQKQCIDETICPRPFRPLYADQWIQLQHKVSVVTRALKCTVLSSCVGQTKRQTDRSIAQYLSGVGQNAWYDFVNEYWTMDIP